MRLLIIFIKKYPWQTAIMLFCLLVSGLLDGIGLSMLLPLLSLTMVMRVCMGAPAKTTCGPSTVQMLLPSSFITMSCFRNRPSSSYGYPVNWRHCW